MFEGYDISYPKTKDLIRKYSISLCDRIKSIIYTPKEMRDVKNTEEDHTDGAHKHHRTRDIMSSS